MPSKTKSEKEFPLAVKAGSSVKVYRDRKRSGDYYRLVYYLGGKRQRLNYRSLDDAKTEAAAKAAQLARGDVDAVQDSREGPASPTVALLKALGRPVSRLSVAANEYAQAAKTLAGHSLLDAVNFYMRHGVNGVSGRMVADAVDDFRQAKGRPQDGAPST